MIKPVHDFRDDVEDVPSKINPLSRGDVLAGTQKA